MDTVPSMLSEKACRSQSAVVHGVRKHSASLKAIQAYPAKSRTSTIKQRELQAQGSYEIPKRTTIQNCIQREAGYETALRCVPTSSYP